MRKSHSNVDGFIPRKLSDKPQNLGNIDVEPLDAGLSSRPLSTFGSNGRELGKQNIEIGMDGINKSDISESLNGLGDINEPQKKLTRKQRRLLKKKNKKPTSLKKKIIRWLIILIVVGVLGTGGYFVYKLSVAGGNIFKGNILDLFTNQPLKEDENGRSNFLILGTSEDDPGHGGSDLTDSMLVVSIDQKNNDISMFSIPRDLYVEYGMACTAGYYGKINAYFTCSNGGDTDEDEQDRLEKTQTFVGDIFGIDIQYGIHVNHTVIKEVVDALDGIDVDIQGSNGDPGILDRNFDWRCNYNCYYVYYDNGIHHLDGEHTLYLAMARGDVAPTYGLSNSNFDREKNQQKILIAIKEKAMSTGTLTDLSAVSGIIDALGDNLRTNIETSEIRTLMDILSNVETDSINTISLVDENEPVVTTGNYNGQSVVMPSVGIFNYSEIQSYINKNLTNDEAANEEASIAVLNATNQAGLAQAESDELAAKGLIVSVVDNAPEGDYDSVEIYQVSDGYDATAEKLSEIYGVSVNSGVPPVSFDDVEFIIIIGSTT